MSDTFVIQQPVQTVFLTGGVLQAIQIGQPIQMLTITTSGPPGPRGVQGPPGPIGTIENLDLPDFTLIFENQLV